MGEGGGCVINIRIKCYLSLVLSEGMNIYKQFYKMVCWEQGGLASFHPGNYTSML